MTDKMGKTNNMGAGVVCVYADASQKVVQMRVSDASMNICVSIGSKAPFGQLMKKEMMKKEKQF